MYQKILLATDGSDHSKKAQAAAVDIAKSGGGEVFAYHIHEVGLMAPIEAPKDAVDLVNAVVKELEAAGVKASGEARAGRVGQAAPEIVKQGKSMGADLIIMGTRGLSDFAGLLMGSVAHKVIHHAECPVLVVR
jgi:nucleotide-binding universal stress UspA family protein